MQPIEVIAERTRKRVEEEGRAPGLALGVLTPDAREVRAYGVREIGGAPVETDTLFEIGSITKLFTALLLADASLRGELKLGDPIDAFLPDGLTAPRFDGEPIRLSHLATHGAALPSFLDAAPPMEDGYADYPLSAFLAEFAAFTLPYAIGSAWKYSNSGVALVGLALEKATGRSYEALLRERVLDPLGMTSTAITLTPALAARTATPHGGDFSPVPKLDIRWMGCAGALWSTAGDMLTFLAAAAGLTETPLAPAFAAMLAVRGPTPTAAAGAPGQKMEQALGWLVIDRPDGRLIGHAGGTVGMGSIALLDLAAREAVVLLTNTTVGPGVFAASLLRPDSVVDEPPMPARRPVVAADPALLARLPGCYRIAPGFDVLVELDARGLMIRPPDAVRMRVKAYGEGQFFVPSFGVTVDFDLAAPGPAGAVTLVAGPQTYKATRAA